MSRKGIPSSQNSNSGEGENADNRVNDNVEEFFTTHMIRLAFFRGKVNGDEVWAKMGDIW